MLYATAGGGAGGSTERARMHPHETHGDAPNVHTTALRRRARSGTTVWALRGAFASVFILFLLAGFNLEGNGVTRSWWAVNVNGVTVETRANTAAAPIEAGSVLRYRYCDKMQETLNMITRRPLTVAVLADTHLREDDTSVMDEIVARETPLRAWSAAGVEVDGRCRAGVTVVWDPAEHELVDAGKVLVDGRVVRVVLRDAQSRQCTAVYGVYMPVRGQGAEVDELVRECFDALDDALAAETHARVAVGGDFNAETAEWAERRTRRTVSDERLAELIDDHALVPQARGATFRPETVGTQIDNWLVRAAMAAEMGAAHTIPGVSGDDHHALEMQEKAAANEESGRGPERPKGSPACKFDEDDEKQFKEEVRDEYIMKGGCMEGATRRWDEELRVFQAAAM